MSAPPFLTLVWDFGDKVGINSFNTSRIWWIEAASRAFLRFFCRNMPKLALCEFGKSL